jgi:hypothetical protein
MVIVLRQVRSRTARENLPKRPLLLSGNPSKVKMRFQSFFMLMTIQPFFLASSYNARVKYQPWYPAAQARCTLTEEAGLILICLLPGIDFYWYSFRYLRFWS